MESERFSRRFDDFSRALSRLAEALAVPKNDLVRDAVLQRFEFTFELAWKTMELWLAQRDGRAWTRAAPFR